MASTQGQDVVLCQLCPNPVEHHCNLCHVDLCSPCTVQHLADKTNRHEIVEFINRKEGPILPECNSHKKNRCEMYCKDCCKPTCVLCVTTEHKKHDFTDIREIIENSKQRIIADLEELENIIAPKLKNITTSVSYAELHKSISVIQDQEDKICKVVRDIGRRMRAEKIKEIQSLATETTIELNEVIQNNNQVLKSSDAATVMSYQSKNEKFRNIFDNTWSSSQSFLPGQIKQNQILKMFGRIQGSIASDNQSNMLNIIKNPVVLNTIQSPYGQNSELWRLKSDGTRKIWTSGNDCKINILDRRGYHLHTIETSEVVMDLSTDAQGDLVFIVYWPETKIFKFESNRIVTILELSNWCPRGLCYTVNGDLLVSMRSLDESQVKVVRYAGNSKTQVIENDSFSRDCRKVLLVIENGNGDICVADHDANTVIVFDASGGVRFKYKGNTGTQGKYSIFKPLTVVSDKLFQLLISDILNEVVHILDRDGNFIRFIEFPCSGGISVDCDYNLIVGDLITGKIRTIKYLEQMS